MIRKFLLIFLFVFPVLSQAELSMRRCMLLPIKDDVGGGMSFPVFEQVELFLKESEFCYYRANSEIINVLGNYKKNLDVHLQNKAVLRVIGEKTKAGSIVKIDIDNQVEGVTVEMKVFGENGSDIYFKEKTQLNTNDTNVIAQTVKNWLDKYLKAIPYDGRITGVLGNQFTVDLGKNFGALAGSEVIIKRALGKKSHPLLKEVVDWETDKIGDGRIFHVSRSQSQGRIIQYDTKKRLRIGDWVIIKKGKEDLKSVKKTTFSENKGYRFGKLGNVKILFTVGSGEATSTGAEIKKLSGTTLGLDLESNIWITRNWWGGIDMARRFGTLKKKEGSLVNESNSLSSSMFSARVGYKYLPMGFFYGPQVDGYMGYTTKTYGLDTQVADGFTEVKFSGLSFGARGSVPLRKVFRFTLGLEFMLKPGYEESSVVYGEADSRSSYEFFIDGAYKYAPNMTFNAELAIDSSKAKFDTTNRSIKVSDRSLKFGASFTF